MCETLTGSQPKPSAICFLVTGSSHSFRKSITSACPILSPLAILPLHPDLF